VNIIYNKHVLEALKEIPDATVDCIFTSSPYYQKRDYGKLEADWGDYKGELGWEPTSQEFINHLLDVTKELKRVLKYRGTLFWNIMDTYSDGNNGEGIPAKSLLQVPTRFARGMQLEQGWILRNTIIWDKGNGSTPFGIDDRFQNVYEFLFFFTKSDSYYFFRESKLNPQILKGFTIKSKKSEQSGEDVIHQNPVRSKEFEKYVIYDDFDSHNAMYPEEFVSKYLKIGCPVGGTVLDPFCGSGTTAAVAEKLGMNSISIEINPQYVELIKARLNTKYEVIK